MIKQIMYRSAVQKSRRKNQEYDCNQWSVGL